MAGITQKIGRGIAKLVPGSGFVFDRPLVLLQSDDWGRVGVRDRESLEQLRIAGLNLGERPYDWYSMETAEDVSALAELLASHRDSVGRSACLGMNFMLANVDFAKTAAGGYQSIELLPLSQGLPGRWQRPGVMAAIHSGIAAGLFTPALHGLTHFCAPAVEAALSQNGERAALLRTLWQAEIPYVHWRMPWIGYEYWHPEREPEDRFLPAEDQQRPIHQAVAIFKKCFKGNPLSACAPGYRANHNTECAWASEGIEIAQNGPGAALPLHFSEGGLLQISRTVEFEPATDPAFSVERALQSAANSVKRGWPIVVSVHAINFQSALQDFRGATLQHLDEFLQGLERQYPDMLYLHDADLLQLVRNGDYEHSGGKVKVSVRRQRFWRRNTDLLRGERS